MPTSSTSPSTGQHGCCVGECKCCAKERERLRVGQKRLDLQKERLVLEQEMLEAERKNFKKIVKLSSKSKTIIGSNTGVVNAVDDNNNSNRDSNSIGNSAGVGNGTTIAAAERDSPRQLKQLEQEIKTLHRQLQTYREQEEQWQRREKEQVASITAAETAVIDCCAKLNLKILELEKYLREVKREHAASTKKHAQDKAKWENGILELVTVDCSSSNEEVKRLNLLVKQYEEENEALRKQNRDLQRSSQSSLKSIPVDEEDKILGDAATAVEGKVAEEINVLEKLMFLFINLSFSKKSMMLVRNRSFLKKSNMLSRDR